MEIVIEAYKQTLVWMRVLMFQEANLQFSVQVQEIQDNLSSVVVVY